MYATIPRRTAHAKGCVTRGGPLLLMFGRGERAAKNSPKLRDFAYLASVIGGVKLVNG